MHCTTKRSHHLWSITRHYITSCTSDVTRIASIIKSGRATNISGAGLSTGSGISDFRSPKTVLYHNLAKYNLKRAEDIFDLRYSYKPKTILCTRTRIS
jgi:NAD-dependent SIR2 family protein deacetylase